MQGAQMTKWLSLAAGSLAGGFSRYFLAGIVQKALGDGFPYGTLIVNLSGCFLIGFLGALSEEKLALGETGRLLLMTGFCGAYTTFSTFILETSNLARGGEMVKSLSNVAVSVVLGFLLFRLGYWAGEAI